MCDEDEPVCRVSTETQGHCGSDILPIEAIARFGFYLAVHDNKPPQPVTHVLNWMFSIEDTKATNHIDSGLSQKCAVLSPVSEATAPETRRNSNEYCTEIHNTFASRYPSGTWPWVLI